MTKIEEIEQNINLMSVVIKDAQEALNKYQKALAELKESKKEGKWKPELHDKYWFRDMNGLTDWFEWFENVVDVWRYNNLPIFKTKEDCERYWHFMDTVKEKSYEFSKEEWDDNNTIQYTIGYDNETGELQVDSLLNTKYLGEIYFKSKEDAQYIIDNFKDELMEYFV